MSAAAGATSSFQTFVFALVFTPGRRLLAGAAGFLDPLRLPPPLLLDAGGGGWRAGFLAPVANESVIGSAAAASGPSGQLGELTKAIRKDTASAKDRAGERRIGESFEIFEIVES